MGKHAYDDFTEVSDIMSCTRIYPFGIGPSDTITVTRDVHSDNNVFVTGMVPSRPTGAHRHDGCDIPKAVWVFLSRGYIECPRAWDDGVAVDFEYITVSSV